MNQEKSLLLHI